ncbi:M10 family metallopeptidase C-terminal domain-containing protein [Pseudomonas sp. rhizo25]|uniref:M10 family metallopeptidase C-terminal domain-containing protein n=1 Tax=Pseudomonas sp. rhizo25 TaxID=3059675 RepID=UPI00288C85C0|nr:M10 family metallopeptidase C-terminal domain-containing protein [Pseudomonas sp. rhizo25]MDT3229794.1 M10 family metallopeptidase C-terminal domain-containing protein [Pseudomonas sp. rhizo25]
MSDVAGLPIQIQLNYVGCKVVNTNLNITYAKHHLTNLVHRNIADILDKNRRGDGFKDGKPTLSSEQVVEASIRAGGHPHSLPAGDDAVVTYDFANATQPDADGNTVSQFSESQKNTIRETLTHFSDVARVQFKEGAMATSNHMQFKIDDSRFDWKDPFYVPSNNEEGAPSQVPLLQRHAQELEQPNNYGSHVVAKAAAFKLGLPSTASVAPGTEYAEDSLAYSLRSPKLEARSNMQFWKRPLENKYSSAPMMDDISTLQKLHGANNQTRSGDTIYGFNSTADRDMFNLTSENDFPLFSVWDGGGEDTFDFSEYKDNQVINLTPGSFSNVGGGVANVSIAPGAMIEIAKGGHGNDIIIGNAADNELFGNDGDDTLYVEANSGYNQLWGGAGNNTFVIGAGDPAAETNLIELQDFVSGRDKLDVSALKAASGRDQINVVSEFSGRGGEAHMEYFPAANITWLRFDTNGDKDIDVMISVNGKIELTDIQA